MSSRYSSGVSNVNCRYTAMKYVCAEAPAVRSALRAPSTLEPCRSSAYARLQTTYGGKVRRILRPSTPPHEALLGGKQPRQEEKRGNRPIQKRPQSNRDVALGQAVDEHDGSDGGAAHGLEVTVLSHDFPSQPLASVV